MNRTLIIFAGTIFCLMSGTYAWAQATAQIGGTARDQSGAVLPGVEIKATQTETGIAREAVTNETGFYVLPNLPIGPYRLEATLPGFRTFVQTGIVLEVNSNSVINVALEVGQVSEQVEVQANAALVETRNVGVGQVMENTRIMDLPLNGRAMIDLISLAAGTTPAPILDGSGGRDPFTKGNVSLAGGLNKDMYYTLDGAYHSNPYDGGYMSMPFPDALEEFKVEAGAMNVQNGVKSSGTVSLVTKSGTNNFHGDLFEFVRNGAFNARNAFASKRDSIKRNQFGGTVGGPVLKNKLFFFGGYQRTTIRQAPSDQTSIVPTPAVLAGDFTTFNSAACNGGRQITLKAPFVNNRIDPALFSKPAVRLASRLPSTQDPCGLVKWGVGNVENDYTVISRIDYQVSANHSIFGRYLADSVSAPSPYNIDHSALNALGTGRGGLAQAFTLGDTHTFGANVVNAFRLTGNRIAGGKYPADYDNAGLGPGDLGINAFSYIPHRPIGNGSAGLVVGDFNFQSTGGAAVGTTRAAVFGANDDLSVLRGNHQLIFGAQMTGWWTNSYSNQYATMSFTFDGSVSGSAMADLFMGYASQLQNGTTSGQNKRNQYFGLYGGDTWKLKPKISLSYGLRWEPYFPIVNRDSTAFHFDAGALAKGIKSARFNTTPPGVAFIGDKGFPGSSGMYGKWLNFSPRLGFGWDVAGDGRTSLRASVARFTDFPPTMYFQGWANGPPFTPRLVRNGVDFQNPWANEPGGDPFPVPYGRGLGANDAVWPLHSPVPNVPYDTPNTQVLQWNLSLQRQVVGNWLISASYIGNETTHLWVPQYTNPPIFLGLGSCTLNGVQYSTCSTTANTDQRRVLSLQFPQTGGQYFGSIQALDAGGTASYNGLLLAVEHRAARGITISGKYTWSHCISDAGGQTFLVINYTEGYTNPASRRSDRGNCLIAGTDRRHVFNLSAVAETPRFSNGMMHATLSGWRIAPIFKFLGGDYFSVLSGQDRALNAAGSQRLAQTLPNPYGNKSVNNYLNPAAFAQPALGTFGNAGAASIRGPGSWDIDAALSRTLQFRETQRVEFRAEAFNLTNSLRMNDPVATFTSGTFGKVTSALDPRILQFALKYIF